MGRASRTVWKLWHLSSSALQTASGQVAGHSCVGLYYAGVFLTVCWDKQSWSYCKLCASKDAKEHHVEAGEFWMSEWVNRKAEVPGVA